MGEVRGPEVRGPDVFGSSVENTGLIVEVAS